MSDDLPWGSWIRTCLDCNAFWGPGSSHQATKRAARAEYEAERPARLARQAAGPYTGEGQCHYCGAPSTTMDHVVARSRGGPNTPDNLVPACRDCNQDKAAREATCRCSFCLNAVFLYGGPRLLPEAIRAYANREAHPEKYLK